MHFRSLLFVFPENIYEGWKKMEVAWCLARVPCQLVWLLCRRMQHQIDEARQGTALKKMKAWMSLLCVIQRLGVKCLRAMAQRRIDSYRLFFSELSAQWLLQTFQTPVV